MAGRLGVNLVRTTGRGVPAKAGLTGALVSVLCVNGRTVCHQLQKRMPFALTRTTIVSEGLKVSLSGVVNIDFDGGTMFSLGIMRRAGAFRACRSVLAGCISTFSGVQRSPAARVTASSGVLPRTLCLGRSMLSGFHLFG